MRQGVPNASGRSLAQDEQYFAVREILFRFEHAPLGLTLLIKIELIPVA